MEIDQFGPGQFGDHPDGFLDLVVPLLGAGLETPVAIGQRRHQGDDYPRPGTDAAQRVDQGQVIPHEFIAVIGPVARIRIIDAQMDD